MSQPYKRKWPCYNYTLYVVPGGTYYSNVNIDNDAREQHCGKLLFSIYGPHRNLRYCIWWWFMVYNIREPLCSNKNPVQLHAPQGGCYTFLFRVEYYLKIFKDCEYLEYSSYLYKTHFVGGDHPHLDPHWVTYRPDLSIYFSRHIQVSSGVKSTYIPHTLLYNMYVQYIMQFNLMSIQYNKFNL